MSRITKQIAEDVSKAMTADKRNAAKELKDKFREAVRNAALSRIPNQVVELFNNSEIRPYMDQKNSVKLIGNGFNYKWVSISEVPHKSGDSCLELFIEEGKTLWEMERAYNLAEDEVKELDLEIYTALYATLKTYKNVEKHFPEAFEHLPKLSASTAISVNLDTLRQKISQ